MTAEQCVEKMGEYGWTAKIVNGIPMIAVPQTEYLLPKTVKKIQKDIRGIGYGRSFGVRPQEQ